MWLLSVLLFVVICTRGYCCVLLFVVCDYLCMWLIAVWVFVYVDICCCGVTRCNYYGNRGKSIQRTLADDDVTQKSEAAELEMPGLLSLRYSREWTHISASSVICRLSSWRQHSPRATSTIV